MSETLPLQLTAALAGRYELVRELGAGGMATVYLARDVRHNRQVALKVLHPELSAVLGPERFLKEIELTARLQHPHILPLFDSGEAGGQLFYVMPYVEGETLRGRLKRETQLPIADAITLAREVAGALQYAHERGVIHRDIKPENILLQGAPGDQHALVADFGIALAVQQAGGTRMTQTGLSLGTPQYMAPEQAMGEKTIDARADVYALGAVTYEMLIGDPPFTGSSTQAILARMLTERAPSLRTVRESVPPQVERVVQLALQRLPADRITSARHFADMLRDIGGNHDERFPVPDDAVNASARGVAALHAPSVPRRATPLQAVPWLLTIALGALSAILYARQPATGATERAITLDVALPADLRAYSGANIAISPDGQQIVYEVSHDGRLVLMHRRLEEDTVRIIPGSERGFTTNQRRVSFLPDGRALLLGLIQEHRTELLTLDGGTRRRTSWPGVGRVTADGALFTRRDSVWFGRDSASLRLVRSGPVGSSRLSDDLTLLPGGRYALGSTTVDGERVRELVTVDLTSGAVTLIGLTGSAPHYLEPGHLLFARPGGDLMVVRFAPDSRRPIGTAVRLATKVRETPGFDVDFAVAADGTVVYARSEIPSAHGEPILVDLRGRQRRLPGRRIIGTMPRVSPDGRRLVLSNTVGFLGGFTVKDLRTGAVDLRASDSTGGRPEWSADGRFLFYRRGDSDELVRRAWDGTGVDSVTRLDGAEILVAPSGAFVLTRRDGDLAYAPVDAPGLTHPLTRTATNETAPMISHDSRLVTYHAVGDAAPDVYVQPVAENSRSVRITTDGGSEPIWSRDGRSVYYRTSDWVLAARLSSTLEPLRIDTLFARPIDVRPAFASPRRQWDLLPDESAFVMLENPPLRNLTVVRGWQSRLERNFSTDHP